MERVNSFLWTRPGLHKPRTRLGDYMVKVVEESVSDVDAVLLLVEPIPNIGGPEQELIDRIKLFHLRPFLSSIKLIQ